MTLTQISIPTSGSWKNFLYDVSIPNYEYFYNLSLPFLPVLIPSTKNRPNIEKNFPINATSLKNLWVPPKVWVSIFISSVCGLFGVAMSRRQSQTPAMIYTVPVPLDVYKLYVNPNQLGSQKQFPVWTINENWFIQVGHWFCRWTLGDLHP